MTRIGIVMLTSTPHLARQALDSVLACCPDDVCLTIGLGLWEVRADAILPRFFGGLDLVMPFASTVWPHDSDNFLERFSFSIMNNRVAAELTELPGFRGELDFLLFLNDDVHAPPDSDFLHSMIRAHLEAGASEVGLKLVYPPDTEMAGRIQHAGHHRGADGTGVHRGLYADPSAPAFTKPAWVQTWAVTGACVLVAPSDFWGVDGFDEDYGTLWQDVDLSMALRHATERPVVCVQDSWIWHFEGATQGGRFEDVPPRTSGAPSIEHDRDRFLNKWPASRDVE